MAGSAGGPPAPVSFASERAEPRVLLPWLRTTDPFPPVELALTDPNGLLAVGGDLSPSRLLEAYRRGIFPWFGDGDPVLWWSPDPRMVLRVDELRITRSLRKVVRSGRFTVTFDQAFEPVMRGCAEPRAGQEGTWITDDMLAAYTTLARMGYAHSVEAWCDGRLAGGLYGVAIGRMFFGESMFARQTDASKVAFVHLVRQLARWSVPMIDCQMSTAHLASLGAREIPRAEFVAELTRLTKASPLPPQWTPDADLAADM
jgi:leucyl/phenylalanyl-tRNA---protein transferase